MPTTVYVAELCRLYVLLVLAAAVVGKAGALRVFAATIADLFRLSIHRAKSAAVTIIAVEALAAGLLLAGSAPAQAGMTAALALFIAFTAAIFVALVQRRAIQCNCFGAHGHPISVWDLVRNTALIAACGVYLHAAPSGPTLGLAAWLLLGGLAVIAALVSAGLDDIAGLAR